MGISDRIHDTLEGWQLEWKDRLGGWAAAWAAKGLKSFMESAEPEAKDLMQASLLKMINDPNITPELKAALEASLVRDDWVATAFGYIGMILGSVLGVLSLGGPPGLVQSYAVDRIAQSYRLDPQAVITGWRRDPATFTGYLEDLRDQGWSDDRIEALKFVTLFYPAPADLVRWQAREVFEPDMVSKYGLDSELGGITRAPFYKAGMTDEQITNYWRAHWEHASWIQIVEMLHRGLITEQDVWDWFRLVEIPPYWRQPLIDTSYSWPTRVDVRRWWDMRTIDEAELRRLYSGMGYTGVNLDNYVLWTKVYVAFPDLLSRYGNGWISLDDVRAELISLGMPAARVEDMIQAKIKSTEPGRISAERDITKTDVYKGVKQGIITRAEAVELLIDLRFNEDEAVYLLDINIPPDVTDPVVNQRELTKTDIKAGIKKGDLTESQAREKLLELRYIPADVEFLLGLYRVAAAPPVDVILREASKADIVKGVKKGLITNSEAHAMLLELKFAPEAADFILLVQVEESPFSAKSFEEFKDITGKYRRATGMTEKVITEELKAAADDLVRIKLEVDALERAVKEERRLLTAEEEVPDSASKKLKRLQVAMNRAKSEMERIQLDYNNKVSAWKHGLE